MVYLPSSLASCPSLLIRHIVILTLSKRGTATASASSGQYTPEMGETATDSAGSEQYGEAEGEGTSPIPSDGQEAIEEFAEFTPAPADTQPTV